MSQSEITDPELDELIAVMGHDLPEVWADASVGPSHGDPGGYRIGVRPYSSDIVAAMEVRDAIVKMPFSIRMRFKKALSDTIARRLGAFIVPSELILFVTANDISFAALEAVESGD